jgi:hypothetical protein
VACKYCAGFTLNKKKSAGSIGFTGMLYTGNHFSHALIDGVSCLFGGNLPGEPVFISICPFLIAATGMFLLKLVIGLLEFDPTFRKLTPTW